MGGVRLTAPPGVTFDQSFLGGSLGPGAVFTRASTGTYYDSAGVLRSAAIDAPRFDYDPATLQLKGLLLEDTSTNVVFPSVISTPGWVVAGPAALGGSITLPDGTTSTTALLAATSTASAIRYVNLAAPPTATIGQIFTVSAYLRKSSASNAFLQVNNAGAASVAYYDLTNGVAVVGADLVAGIITKSAAITPAGNGWFRVSFTFTAIFNGTIPPLFGPCAVVSATGDNRAAAGVVGEGIYIWGAQVEALPYMSSYIPTTTVSVTRAADSLRYPIASVTGFDTTKGSLAYEYIIEGYKPAFGAVAQFVGANLNTDLISVGQFTTSGATGISPILYGMAIGVAGVGIGSAIFALLPVPNNVIHRDASAWTLGAARPFAAHDGAGNTDGTGPISSLPVIVSMTVGGPQSFQGQVSQWARRARYWPRQLSQAELISVTT